MTRDLDQGEVSPPTSTWAIGFPFGPAGSINQSWISAFSAHLAGLGTKVVWGVQAAPIQAPTPEGVVAYPYSDLAAGWLEPALLGGPLLLNVDGPSPYADRTRHLWRSFDLGARDVFFLPEAQLADLEALWDIYAYMDIRQAPLTLLRLSAFSPSGRAAMSYDELIERLHWVAYRLNSLDLPGKKITIWPGSTLISQLLEKAGLPVTDVIPVAPVARSRGALIAVATVGDDEERLIGWLSGNCGGRPVDVLCLSPADVESFKNAASFDVHGAGAPLSGRYDRVVVAADLVFSVARAGIDCAKGQAFILDEADGDAWDAIAAPANGHESPPPMTPDLLAVRLLELVADASASAPEPLPVVVHIAPAWPSAGSTHVFQGQLDWLRKRGLPTICLHLDTADWEWHDALAGVPELLIRLPGEQALHRWFLSRPRWERQAEEAAGISPPYSQLSLEGEERISRQAGLPSSLMAFLKYRKVHFVVLNYGHNWPLVERLGLEGSPIALETHDIRPIQHALYNSAPVIESALEIELAMFARATCTVFINRQEKALFEKRYPKNACVGAFPFRDTPLPATVHSRFETPLTSLLSVSQVSLDMVGDLFVPRAERRRRFAVFVGSNHAANIESLQWFFLNVYPHGLVDTDLSILVAGAIDEAFIDTNLPNVVFCGRLSELDLLYQAADVLLLPVTAGTGLPIKTLDALTAGVPFVATSKAMETIPGLVELAGAYDDGPAFAARVRTLAFDDKPRAAFAKKIEDYRAGQANQGEYEHDWDEVLKAMKSPIVKSLQGPVGCGLMRYVDRPAGRLDQRYYFWSGHGLEEMIGALQEEDGLMLSAPYVRLGLSCTPTFPAANALQERLEVTARLTASEKTRALIALQGTVRGALVLEAGRPMHIALEASLHSDGRPHRLSLEIRLETPTGEAPGPVHLQQLTATCLS
jgi:glycosyltransferase involved in cell wall biosynthesis